MCEDVKLALVLKDAEELRPPRLAPYSVRNKTNTELKAYQQSFIKMRSTIAIERSSMATTTTPMLNLVSNNNMSNDSNNSMQEQQQQEYGNMRKRSTVIATLPPGFNQRGTITTAHGKQRGISLIAMANQNQRLSPLTMQNKLPSINERPFSVL